VKFTSLKNAKFAKDVVAFDKGIATVTVTSISSATAIQDTIIVAIADAEDKEAIGKTFTINLDYVPKGSGGELAEKVFATYAESDRASDVWVQFNKPFDFDKLYADWTKNPNAITVNGRQVVDIVKASEKSVKLVLTDKGKADVLPDNSTITLKTEYTGTQGMFVESKVEFILVDHQPPSAVAAEAPNYRTIVAQFTEPVAKENAEKVSNWVLNGKQLSTSDVIVNGVTVGRAIDAKGTISDYDKKSHTDNRHYVTIQLTANGAKKLNAAGSQNLLQAYNITDFAGYTDTTGQNKAATQEFRFVTPDAPDAPNSVTTMDSVEQYRIKFNSPVSKLNNGKLSASNFKLEMQNGKNADGTPNFVEIGLEDTVTTDSMAVVRQVSDTEYLIELEEDWTVKYNTQKSGRNYYTPDWNKVRVTVFADDIKNDLDVKMTADRVETLTMNLDSTNPEIKLAQQSKDVAGNLIAAVDVEMSEPVQLNLAAGTNEITPSEQQKAKGGVPIPTFEFVNEDKTVTLEGELVSSSEDDMSFTVKPKKDEELKPGKWTLYIRSISDDVGNTAGTVSTQIEIKGAIEQLADPRIVWATAHDNVDLDQEGTQAGIADADIVHIQYGTEMSLDALTSTVYTINGKQIPEGASITSVKLAKYDVDGDYKYDHAGTLVTIKLPKDFLGDKSEEVHDTFFTSSSNHHVLNVVKSLKDASGKELMTPREVEMKYHYKLDKLATYATSFELAYDDYTYDGKDKTKEVIYGDLRITGENINLKNVTIKGNLIIDEEVQTDFVMENVDVDGDVIINGGDSNSVKMIGSTITGNIEVNKVDLHLVLQGTTVTGKIKVNVTGVNIEDDKANTVEIDKNVAKTDAIKAANKALDAIPAAGSIKLENLDDAKAKVKAAEDAIEAAKKLDAKDSDFRSLARLEAAKAKIKELEPAQVDVTPINTAIDNATAAQNGVKVSVDGSDVLTTEKWVTQAAKTALLDAIQVAVDAKPTVKTAQEVTNAATALNNAVTTYNNAKQDGTKAALDTTAIDTAVSDANAAKVVVSTDGSDVEPTDKWVKQDVQDALDDAIAAAQAAKTTATTQQDVTNAVNALNNAVTTYNNAKQDGTKTP